MSVFNEFGVEPSLFVTSIPTLTQTCPLWQIRAVFGPMWDFRPKGSPFAEIGEIRSKAGRLTQFRKSLPFFQIGLSLEITQGGYFDSNTFFWSRASRFKNSGRLLLKSHLNQKRPNGWNSTKKQHLRGKSLLSFKLGRFLKKSHFNLRFRSIIAFQVRMRSVVVHGRDWRGAGTDT
jgi:hypothetical protein